MFKKTLLTLSVLAVFSQLLIHAPKVYSQVSSPNPTDYQTTINGPTITPPDYIKNECPVCPKDNYWDDNHGCCKYNFSFNGGAKMQIDCQQPTIQVCIDQNKCFVAAGCSNGGLTLSTFEPKNLCDKLVISDEQAKCKACMDDDLHVWTAMGCLPINPALLISTYVISFFIAIAGGVSFIFVIYGAFLVMTSQGDTERIKKGKKYVNSAIKGLLVVIFATLIFKILGVDLLRIPGLS